MERGWMQFPVPESCIDLKEDLEERDNRPIMLRVFLYALCVSEESASFDPPCEVILTGITAPFPI